MRAIFLISIFLFSFTMKAQNKHPMQVKMVSIMVADPVKAHQFYTEVLGFESYMFDPENYIAIVKSSLAPNGVTILLEPTEPHGIEIAKKFKSEIYTMGLPCISFSSPDIDATYEELKAKGVKFKKVPTDTPWGRDAIFDDNNGNYIQLFQLKE